MHKEMTQLKAWRGMNYWHSFNGFHTILMKGNRAPVEEEAGRLHAHPGMQGNISGIGANCNHTPWTQHCFCSIPDKDALVLPESHQEESSSQTKIEAHSIRVWTVVCTNVKGIKIKERMRSCSNSSCPKGHHKDTRMILDPILLLWTWYSGDSWRKLHGVWGLDGNKGSMLIFQPLKGVYSACRRMSLLVGNAHWHLRSSGLQFTLKWFRNKNVLCTIFATFL